ncbi:unnamed protein product [Cuscuta europaea]|uniref:Uncharacterized protein n=1 Tax=Cuscuta europaea TaxID=41803 RepID=A0A9P0ZAQ3_CUSEU|nr:unnamed protein product [Cuscuta europaea]
MSKLLNYTIFQLLFNWLSTSTKIPDYHFLGMGVAGSGSFPFRRVAWRSRPAANIHLRSAALHASALLGLVDPLQCCRSIDIVLLLLLCFVSHVLLETIMNSF